MGKITSLYGRCFQAERDVAEVERQLSVVEHGQVEVEQVLERYEMWIDEMIEQNDIGSAEGAGGVDGERERTYVITSTTPLVTTHTNYGNRYKTAEACSTRLTEMSHNLSSMIDEINSASSKLTKPDTNATTAGDPLAQIVRVLNSHLQQLQTIDSGAAALAQKVEGAQREASTLGVQGRGVNGGAGQWLDGFGRSYLGRS